MTVRGVHFWARVLVAPERVQRVKHDILQMGQFFLRPGEILEVETRPGDDAELAITVGDPDIKQPAGACIVAWNETAGDITVWGDDADHIAAIAEPVTTALAGRAPYELLNKAVWLHSDRINSVKVGDVHVFFDRSEDRKKQGPSPEEVSEQVEQERGFFRSRGLTHPVDAARDGSEPDSQTEGGTLGRLERAKAEIAELARYAGLSIGYRAQTVKEDLLHTIEDAIVQVRQDDRFASETVAALSEGSKRGTVITLQPGTSIEGMDPQKLEELLRSLKAAGIVVRPAA